MFVTGVLYENDVMGKTHAVFIGRGDPNIQYGQTGEYLGDAFEKGMSIFVPHGSTINYTVPNNELYFGKYNG